MKQGLATVAQHTDFDEIIDARTPAEFAEDHLPGALNLPVLDNAQRIVVGTLYKQRSAFEARRVGGAMVAENIARHLAGPLANKPKDWRPLVYCWRGGQRSGAFVTWLRMVGWDAHQLEGGYKAWRRMVVAELAQLPARLTFRVVCGPTGSAKTRLLHALAARGAQVLDLEGLAGHRGSVLGALPGQPQPTQKSFETALFGVLRGLDPNRPVYVEAESRKIGAVHIPEALIMAIRASACVFIEASRSARLAFLLRDYAWLGDEPARLQADLSRLKGLHSNETLARWQDWAATGALAELFGELIDLHYDPLYRRSQRLHYSGLERAPRFYAERLDDAGIDALAAAILAAEASRA
ncbi:tRNA 2-selenouridine(34) synthase MnmH [Zoogloeaceae bacteirum Par-f-2]|jgi:tRNA 2-selenouridine synthase|uniref:tRNA 2-selenouridine(34) synthase MnmH n=1 Tax=Pseudothauera hydrothermalis TaxID=2184083 RepID=UPI000C7AF320|nr:tRNA 2-selenouridine(34) synthase MnmH [Pseudothauera hydrothermalis]AUM01483.1 tRNA 2-selenouridine(34) synthase MnmH [Rhodocyclaceae bacterium]AVZ79000.1 tRNA 2-selenouridine(34) synthase MnmH [Zoogloeaceae bacteirum Par-f-2]